MSRIFFSTAVIGLLASSVKAAPHPRDNWWGSWDFWGGDQGSDSVVSSFGIPTAIPTEFVSTVPSSTIFITTSVFSEPVSTGTIASTTSISIIETEPADPTLAVSTTTSVSAAPSSSTLSSDEQAYLDAHNTLRAAYGADALSWSDTLASVAQNWANGCVFEHSGSQYGENLAAGTGDYTIPSAMQLWADEASSYNASNPEFSHFTQMVWKSTTELGCAVATCNDLVEGWGSSKFYVCNYNPAGNVIGEFSANVQA